MDESKIKQTPEWGVLVWGASIVAIFAAIMFAISLRIGVVFAVPNARIFNIVGVHSWIPIAMASIVYLLYQLLRGQLSWATMIKRLSVDMSYIALLVIAFYLHFHLKAWIPLINPELYDDFYWHIEQYIRPFTDFIAPIRVFLSKLPFFDKIYQLGYIFVFVTSFVIIAYVNRAVFRRFSLAFLLAIMLGCFSYLIAPAIGPFLYETGLNADATMAQSNLLKWHYVLREQGVAWLNPHMGDFFGASLAAMPSLHVAYCFMITYAIFNIYKIIWIRVFYLAFFMLVVCESVWSKWHYWIDAPAGIMVALISLWIAQKMIGEDYGKN